MLARARGRLHRLLRSSKGPWIALAVSLTLVGVLAAVLSARAISDSEDDEAQTAFHLSSTEIAASLKQTLQHEEDLVVGASAFFSANPHASPTAFDRWMESVHAMQRYPELENIGLVEPVEASRLSTFEARLAANPVRPLGPESTTIGGFQILPPGTRPHYCFAVAGMARSIAFYLPAGLDYCKLIPQLIPDAEAGLAGYAPVLGVHTTTLGVETPIYRGAIAHPTAKARRQAFVGWLGELLAPDTVLKSALQGHPSLAVTFRYESSFSHVAFTWGSARKGAQSMTIPLLVGAPALGDSREGWTVQTFGPPVAAGVVVGTWKALALLIVGLLLSVAIGLLVLVLATGRMRALSLVREKTRELSQKNRELSYQALHDTLTGLPNRALVLDRTEQLLARASREPGMVVGALFVDIDEFKRVNDNFGHAAGDQVLRTVAGRLQRSVRTQDTVGRLGGDEFVVLGELVVDDVSLDVLSDRLADAVREPVELDRGRETVSISVTASIGVTVGRYASADELLCDADIALYSAKAAGKDRCALFEASMRAAVDGRFELQPNLSELSAAVEKQQLYLVYQPIFELPGRELIGVEALIRWRHLQRDVVLPGDFIPLAEESGLIIPIGRWVLDEACRQAARWYREGLRLGVSVNVSAYQLGRDRFAEDVREALGRHEFDPSLLTLEITETTLMRNAEVACRHLEEMKALGVRIAIDDFGTGYASLSQLQRLPVDTLKIDRSFVAALKDGARSRRLLRAILNVGETLSMAVIAEGVEQQSQLTALEAMGCRMCQGFLLARPSPAEDVRARLQPAPQPPGPRPRQGAGAAVLSG